MTVLLFLGLAGSILLNVVLLVGGGPRSAVKPVRERYFFPEKFQTGTDKVAVMHLEGTIYEDGSLFDFAKRQIERVRADKAVKAVVLRINSPGGTVTGSDYLYHRLKELREEKKIPIVVSMGSLAASGGYYVSMAVGDRPDSIFAEPMTWTGSIGVIVPLFNVSQLLNRWGIEDNAIASGPLKEMGSFAKPMSEQERQVWNALVHESFQRFKSVIKEGRPRFQKDPAALDRLATGQVYTAEQAKQNGLIDEIGFTEKAIDRAIALAGVDRNNVQVVEYEQEPSLADLFLGTSQAQSRGADVQSLVERLAAFRAYYLPPRMLPVK